MGGDPEGMESEPELPSHLVALGQSGQKPANTAAASWFWRQTTDPHHTGNKLKTISSVSEIKVIHMIVPETNRLDLEYRR